MFLAAMLDAGFPLEKLRAAFSQLGLPEYRDVSFQKVMKGAISAGKVEFLLNSDGHAHDHDEHHHDHEPHHHHRSYTDIRSLLDSSQLPRAVIEKSQRVFYKIAEAEAAVHQTSIDDVHFHEVGAVDSILDVVGAAAALDYFKIEKMFASALPLGSGQVMTQHGLLPIPAPATAWLLADMSAPVRPSQVSKELVTPTGAGILAAFAAFEEPSMNVLHLGTGAGNAELPHPNIMRVLIGESAEIEPACVELSCNLDDMPAEQIGAVMDRLFDLGALDVFFTPIQMKKNRPAVMLTVIANGADEQKISDLMLRETTTLGVRVHDLRRHKAEREILTLDTSFGTVRVKEKRLNGKRVGLHPEFDDCQRIARETGLPLIEIYRRILKELD